MDTRKDDWPSAHTEGPRNERRKTSLGSGSIAIAVAAVVAVVVAGIWTLAPREGAPAASGFPAAPESAADAAPDPVEAGRTIYLWDPATGDGTVLLSASSEVVDAELSRDGKQLVYASGDAGEPPQIHLLDGGREHVLTHMPGGASEPTWSPDGSRIAFSGSRREDGDTDIFVMNADGSRLRRVATTPNDDGHPDWSPDGLRIVFHARSDDRGVPGGEIWLASVRTSTLTELPPRHPQFGAVDPAWSPDGRWIAYSRFHRSTLNGQVWKPEIWRMRPDGTDRSRAGIPGHSTDSAQSPSWSPDGRFIVFEGERGLKIVDPRTERSWSTQAFSTASDPSWNREGILLALAGDPPAKPPGLANGFEIQKGIDVTIVMTVSTCAIEGPPPTILPGELTLEFVNASRLDARFMTIRLAPGQTVADLQADPGSVASMFHSDRYVDVSGRGRWFTPQVVAGDRWAVACWRDVERSANGFFYKPFRIASFTVAAEGGNVR